MKIRLLFICLGNICRSPAAEGVMKAIVKREGREKDFYIDSAGIGGWHVGDLPDSRMRKHGGMRGYKFDSRARQFSHADFADFDYIFVMDHENYRAVTSMAKNEEERQKVRMLTDYLVRHKDVSTVPDPYYGSDHAFEYALDLIEDACENLFENLQKSLI